MSRILYIFPSHAFRYSEHREGLHALLEESAPAGVSVASLAPTEEHPIHSGESNFRLALNLMDRIVRCDAFLVMAGLYASRSMWMHFEVAVARVLGKPIIAVAPRGQQNLSLTATEYADEEVRWNGKAIWEAVFRLLPSRRQSALLGTRPRLTGI